MFDSAWPALTIAQAHVINFALTCGYVIPLYLTKYTRPSLFGKDNRFQSGWRNDPAVIKARLLSVTLSTSISCIAMHFIIGSYQKHGPTVSYIPSLYTNRARCLKVLKSCRQQQSTWDSLLTSTVFSRIWSPLRCLSDRCTHIILENS
jgi:hypothetical protein